MIDRNQFLDKKWHKNGIDFMCHSDLDVDDDSSEQSESSAFILSDESVNIAPEENRVEKDSELKMVCIYHCSNCIDVILHIIVSHIYDIK